MLNKEKRAGLLKDYFESLSNHELMNLWNDYCQDNCYDDDEVFYNDEEFLNMFSDDILGLIQKVEYGSYSSNDNYITLDGNGNFKTSDYITDLIYINDLVRYYIDDEDFLLDNGIIEEEEEEEEEER